MMERVLAYGHPAPEKVGAFLAWTWLCVPLLLAVLWRTHETYARPLAWGTDSRSIVKRYLVVMAIFLGTLFYIAYWPSQSLAQGWITGPLGSINDARLRLFRSDAGLGLSAPIWATVVASTLDAVCVETRALVSWLRNHADAADQANAKE